MNRSFFTMFCVAAFLQACTPTVDIRGNLPDPEMVAKIEVGTSSQEQVMGWLGTPSSAMNYGGEVWYYVYVKTERVSFWDPKVLDYKALVISFDDAGKVKDMRHLAQKDMKTVDTVSRETPTAGREYSFVDQLVSNVGRFGKKDSKPSQ